MKIYGFSIRACRQETPWSRGATTLHKLQESNDEWNEWNEWNEKINEGIVPDTASWIKMRH